MNDIYILDTNIISALLNLTESEIQFSPLINRIRSYKQSSLIICECVLYEIERGLNYRQSKNKMNRFQSVVLPLFQVVPIILADWKTASILWASLRAKGIQLSDVDLLVAAVSIRLNGVIITDDQDFDNLPVRAENWLKQ